MISKTFSYIHIAVEKGNVRRKTFGELVRIPYVPSHPASRSVLGTVMSYRHLVACNETDKGMPSHDCPTLSKPLLRMYPLALPLVFFSAQLTLSHVESATSETSKQQLRLIFARFYCFHTTYQLLHAFR